MRLGRRASDHHREERASDEIMAIVEVVWRRLVGGMRKL